MSERQFTESQRRSLWQLARERAEDQAARRYPPNDKRASAYIDEYTNMEYARLIGAEHD